MNERKKGGKKIITNEKKEKGKEKIKVRKEAQNE